MAPKSTFDGWNAYLDGQLGQMLKDWRNDGLSDEQIARTLYHEHDIDIGSKTIGRWCDREGIARKRKNGKRAA